MQEYQEAYHIPVKQISSNTLSQEDKVPFMKGFKKDIIKT